MMKKAGEHFILIFNETDAFVTGCKFL